MKNKTKKQKEDYEIEYSVLAAIFRISILIMILIGIWFYISGFINDDENNSESPIIENKDENTLLEIENDDEIENIEVETAVKKSPSFPIALYANNK